MCILLYRVNRASLDTIGIIGFAHDFQTLYGKSTFVTDAFEAFGPNGRGGWYSIFYLFIPFMPILLRLPNKRKALLDNYRKTLGTVGEKLVARSRSEKKELGGVKHPASGSIIGTLRMSK